VGKCSDVHRLGKSLNLAIAQISFKHRCNVAIQQPSDGGDTIADPSVMIHGLLSLFYHSRKRFFGAANLRVFTTGMSKE
jgi:hypothetical protein